MTYTLGTGTSTTVVTTTIKQYSTATVYATLPGGGSGGAGGEGGAGSISTAEGEVAASSSSTTTLTTTSTSTRYVTVLPPSAAAGGGSGGSAPSGVSAVTGEASGGACVPVTVTVTSALATVTVVCFCLCPLRIISNEGQTETALPSAVSTAAGEISEPSAPVKQAISTPAAASNTGPVVILSTATVMPLPVSTGPTGAPYGYANGTVAAGTASSSGYVASSGFRSVAKPSPVATGGAGW